MNQENRFLHKRIEKLMGNRFELSVVTNEKKLAEEVLAIGVNEISRIEKLLTTFNESSQVSEM